MRDRLLIPFVYLMTFFLFQSTSFAAPFDFDISDNPKEMKKGDVSDSNTPGKSSTKGNFLLGPEDVLQIAVWGNKELTTEMPVRPDGYISFPLIGDVKAKGLTPDQLKEKMADRLRDYITDASITVIVKEINSIKISIWGQVNAPDTYKVNRPISLLHLFSLGKGFTEQADLHNSYLLRNGKKLELNIHDLVNSGDFSQNIWLQQDDLVYIADNFDKRINIMGEVQKPQVITFHEGMTVLDAILTAEGLTDVARPRSTQVYRKSSSGSKAIQKIQVELDKVIFDGDLSKNLLLQPGDIIHVPRSFF